MILTRIQIENYKQYQGSHDIEVPAEATIGVIGENGTGKTTLFEAIEWCLYSPRNISPADVRPRGFTGQPRSRSILNRPILRNNSSSNASSSARPRPPFSESTLRAR